MKNVLNHLVMDFLVDLHELDIYKAKSLTILLLRYFPKKEVVMELIIMRVRIKL